MKKLKPSDIESIIFRLTNALVIDQIFLWTFEWRSHKCYMLHVLMQKNNGQYYTEANMYIHSVVERYENIGYVVCYPHEMQKKINQGIGRTFLICQPQNLIYINPSPKETIKIPDLDMKAIMERVQIYIQKEIRKMRAFLEGYQFYFDTNNYGHAAFMLHQVVELAFRAAEHLLIGEEKRTHCLKTHQNYVEKFAYELGHLFHGCERKSIIHKLDDAYSAVRYDQDFNMRKGQLEKGSLIAATMLEWLVDYINSLLQDISENFCMSYIVGDGL